jgi:hypothetical protein
VPTVDGEDLLKREKEDHFILDHNAGLTGTIPETFGELKLLVSKIWVIKNFEISSGMNA